MFELAFSLSSDITNYTTLSDTLFCVFPLLADDSDSYTDNTEAYAYYIRGRQSFNNSKEGNAQAIKMYEKAIELDPNYALAHASLSNALTQMYWSHGKNREHLPRAKEEVDRALKLAPDMPGAHVALGRYYYQGCFDYENALEQFETARRSHPNHVWAIAWTAYAKRRQGKFEEALVDLLRAAELDPVRASFLDEIANTYMLLRRYEESERYCERAIRLAPDWPPHYDRLATTYLEWQGNTDQARKVLNEALLNMKKGARDNGIYFTLVLIDIYEGEYSKALEKLTSKLKDFENMAWYIPDELRRAEIYGYMGNEELKQQYYQAAVDILEKKVEEYSNDDRVHSSLGKAYAGVGRKQEAIRQGELGVTCLPMEKDAVCGPFRVEDLARIYVMVGEYDKAIEQLKFLLEKPTELTVPLLTIDPAWKPLHDHPRFQKLLKSDK